MASLLEKIYSGWLHAVRLWVAVAEIWHGHNYVQMAYKHLTLKPRVLKYFSLQLQPKHSQSNLSGWVQVLIPQAINALHGKG